MSLIPSILGKKSSVYDPFSLAVDVWDPFHGFGFGELSRPQFHLAKEASAVANTQIDWKETPEAHIFKADLPGLKKEEVQIQVEEGRILQISGQRSKEEEQNSDKWHRIERSHGRFLRRFRLPEAANVEELRAALDDGVLTVTVPKQSQPKPDVKSVQISG